MVTISRNCAGVTSSRSDRSSPIRTICPQPQGQLKSSGASTRSSRGRSFGKDRGPRGVRAGRSPVRAAAAVSCSSVAVASATSLAIGLEPMAPRWLVPRMPVPSARDAASRSAARNGRAEAPAPDVQAARCGSSIRHSPAQAPEPAPRAPRARRAATGPEDRGRARWTWADFTRCAAPNPAKQGA